MARPEKVALVTGAGRGIGRSHALSLAKDATVIVNDVGGDSHGDQRDNTPAEEVAAEIESAGGRAVADFTDISDWSQAQALVDRIVADHGRLDVLVNNAGVSRSGHLGTLTEDDWGRQFEVNVKGPTALMDAAARHWQAAGFEHRAVINTSSPAGMHPIAPIGVYSATKAAIAALTVSAAEELSGLGVRVNGIVPIARTRLIDHAPSEIQDAMRPGEGFDAFSPDHVSQVVRYLASPACRFSGRLFGCQGDQLYLFREWSADHEFRNGGTSWTQDDLATALSAVPPQDVIWEMVAGGRRETQSPSSRVVTDLAEVGQ